MSGPIDTSSATVMLGALAHETRLTVFRMLVAAGPEGMPAGEIARALSVPHNTLSTHLAQLARAGLVKADRAGRSIFYRVEIGELAGLLGYLVRDCCGGHPELCGQLGAQLAGASCGPSNARQTRGTNE